MMKSNWILYVPGDSLHIHPELKQGRWWVEGDMPCLRQLMLYLDLHRVGDYFESQDRHPQSTRRHIAYL